MSTPIVILLITLFTSIIHQKKIIASVFFKNVNYHSFSQFFLFILVIIYLTYIILYAIIYIN